MSDDHDDLFFKAQQAAEAHLERCFDAMDAEEQDDGRDVESPAIAPFCGCARCQVRETLHAAWPVLREAALEGYPE
jgi:hypothetical protein